MQYFLNMLFSSIQEFKLLLRQPLEYAVFLKYIAGQCSVIQTAVKTALDIICLFVKLKLHIQTSVPIDWRVFEGLFPFGLVSLIL